MAATAGRTAKAPTATSMGWARGRERPTGWLRSWTKTGGGASRAAEIPDRAWRPRPADLQSRAPFAQPSARVGAPPLFEGVVLFCRLFGVGQIFFFVSGQHVLFRGRRPDSRFEDSVMAPGAWGFHKNWSKIVLPLCPFNSTVRRLHTTPFSSPQTAGSWPWRDTDRAGGVD